jgi:hypothetical protein
MMAGSVLTVLPVLVLFVLFQREYIRGVHDGRRQRVTATLARALRAAAATLLLASLARADATPITVDDFEDVSAWSSHPAEGVALDLHSDAGAHGKALRLDFRFEAGAGYAVARRAVDLTLPDNYEFRFAVRGECPPNDLSSS